MANNVNDLKVLEVLQAGGKLSDEQVKLVTEAVEAGSPIDAAIGQQGLTEEDITQARAQQYGLPYANLTGVAVPKEVLNVIPSRIAQTYSFIAYESDGTKIKLGVMKPIDLKAEEALQIIANRNGLEFLFTIISENSYQAVINQYSDIESEVKDALAGTEAEGPTEEEAQRTQQETEITADVESAPISKIVSTILKNAITKEASDIHVEPVGEEVRVRYRVDGVLQQVLTLPIRLLPSIVSRVKVLSSLKIDETRLPQDGRFSTTVDNRDVDLRVSIMPITTGGIKSAEKVVMRVLDKSKGALKLEQLGLWGKRQRDVVRSLKQPYGMFMMTGPTGSGKTTTLYAGLSMINQEGVNIVTLEDPVEYYMAGVNQSQINPDIGFTFASGLRSILRQDPDGIMVGEVRDQETAEMAIHSALTGHIVLTTLHTNSASGAIPRMVDMGIEPFLIASSMNAVAAQRLVRTLCPDCKEEVEPASEIKEMLEKEIASIPPREMTDVGIDGIHLYRGKSCKNCRDGYKGRNAIYEVITMTEELRQLIPSKPSSRKVEEVARRQRSISLFQDGIIKALAGMTSLEEVMRITKEDQNIL
ncbi:GspE/PulE family protein [Patescibacteria group bacterium]